MVLFSLLRNVVTWKKDKAKQACLMNIVKTAPVTVIVSAFEEFDAIASLLPLLLFTGLTVATLAYKEKTTAAVLRFVHIPQWHAILTRKAAGVLVFNGDAGRVAESRLLGFSVTVWCRCSDGLAR